MESFQIATFNIHHGKDLSSNYSTSVMIESIESLGADIILVQELDVLALRTYFVNQPKKIARALGYNYVTDRVRFFGLGFQHNAIFSKFPIVGQSEISLPQHGNQQLRKSLLTDIEIGSTHLHVANTHLHTHRGKTRYNRWAQDQLMFLMGKHKQCDTCIIGGDLNMLPKEVVPVARENGYEAPHEYHTSPAINPRGQIDWLLSKNILLENVCISELLCSDHRALTATATILPV